MEVEKKLGELNQKMNRVMESIERLDSEIVRLRIFSESFLRLILLLSFRDDPIERLTYLLRNVASLPELAVGILARDVLGEAARRNLGLADVSKALVQGLGLALTRRAVTLDMIRETYGPEWVDWWNRNVLERESPNPRSRNTRKGDAVHVSEQVRSR